jgi:hypothetical protein
MPERDPHHALNQPVGEPDPTEWPDPYDKRPDPLAPGEDAQGRPRRRVPGATSTSEPHPDQDPEAINAEAPKLERYARERKRRQR